jgi:rubrerythrin
VRSRAAAAILSREGFKRVYSMEGGMNAWKGLVAKGAPEAGMAYFDQGKSPGELTALAWLLEEGSRKFYAEMSGKTGDEEAAGIFQDLSGDEERHKNSLFELYQTLSGSKIGSSQPQLQVGAERGVEYLEGGILLREALEWVRGKDLRDALDLSISLEANAADLYIKMERKMEDPRVKRVFQTIVAQERTHLKRLSGLLEKRGS